MNLYPGIESLASLSTSRHPSVTRSLGISSCRAMVGRLFLTTFGGTSLGCCSGGRPLSLVHLLPMKCSSFNLLFMLVILLTLCGFCFVVKVHPELKGKFKEQVQEAIKYASTIEDFDKLVDPRMLAHHCLGPKPSPYILYALDREERKHELS